MKKLLLRALFFLIPFLYSVYVSSQPGKERDCTTTCFSSEILTVGETSGSCTSYEIKVSLSGKCDHALSHFAVAIPCGKIQNLWNSQHWAQETGTDPTTGLTGFKIDGITGFGEGPLSYFTVKFDLCYADEGCSSLMKCWQPQVAYKAATCVNYETLRVNCKSLKASLYKEDVSCNGAADGSMSVIIDAGQDPYVYLWSTGSTGNKIDGLAAGSYSVLIRDASGEEVTLEESIVEAAPLLISAATTNASCNGQADGSIDLSISGGQGEYTFSWSTGQHTEDLPSLAAGQYTVTAKDGRGCVATAAYTIANISRISISATQVKPDCNDSNGSIDISVSGGAAPYHFEWSNGMAIEDIANLNAGLYSVRVSDNSGCVEEKSFLIRENNTLALKTTTSPTTCTGEASGEIDLTVSGGTGPYTYSWSNDATTEDLSNLSSGYYTVVVRDSKGCTVQMGSTVSKNTFQIARVVLQPTCHDDENGSITLGDPIGGVGPFTYLWSNGETGTGLSNLDEGMYSVTVTDATGCSRTLTATINNPPAIVASATVSNSQCNSEGFFTIDLEISGGSGPYTTVWSNGNTAEDLQGLASGTYTVMITDAHGCSISKEVIVQGEASTWTCLINALPSTPACGSANNTLSTSVTGADSYSWSVESADGTWSITSGDSPAILFTAGAANTSATFTLTIRKNDCTKTCSYTVSSCIPSDDGEGTDPGGENPGEENPGEHESGNGGSQGCDECFSTVAKLVTTSGGCRTYEMEVNSNGLCLHELSHWTLAIPCGTISSYSNSGGWSMVFGKDPTTGLYGLKVDNINDFGKDLASFTVQFTICESAGCELSSWKPVIAYKAAQCVAFETVNFSNLSATATVSVFPNPFEETINFEWTASNDRVRLEIIDQHGNTVSAVTSASGKGGNYFINLESSQLPKGLYYYRLIVDGKNYNGKISKR
jgi:hypothetical protein